MPTIRPKTDLLPEQVLWGSFPQVCMIGLTADYPASSEYLAAELDSALSKPHADAQTL
jgi:hypothetical protein